MPSGLPGFGVDTTSTPGTHGMKVLGGQSIDRSEKKVTKEHVDVIVIGAGIAGLAAAQRLTDLAKKNSQRSVSVAILEARDRIGGRTYTRTDPEHSDVWVDMGATWVHGNSKKNPIVRLAQGCQVSLVPDQENSYSLYNEEGQQIPNHAINNTIHRYEKIIDKAKVYAQSLDHSISILEAIQTVNLRSLEDPIFQYLYSERVEFDYGGPLNTVDTLQFDEDGEFCGGDAIPIGGFQTLLKELAKGLDIRLSHPVTKIESSQDPTGNITISTTSPDKQSVSAFVAPKVICTLPLGVLKLNSVQFLPPLSDQKFAAIQRMGWGSVNKVAVLFDKVFWPAETQGFGIAALNQRYTYILNKYAFTKIPMLEIYAVGAHAKFMDEQQDEDAIINDVLQVLASVFRQSREDLAQSLLRFFVGRWALEEYSRGAYSYSSTTTHSGDYNSLRQSEFSNRIYFAGEHTIQLYRGTVHGAYLSGRKAAEDLASDLR